MHDGQNLFDRATSFAGEWGVDETLEAASGEGLEAIVVGIPNMGRERCDEYSPWVDPRAGGGRGDRYLRFLTETVKPLIDRDFRTRPERDETAIVGSSMGGLISLYGFFRHPLTFGSAGVMSPALWFAGSAVFAYLARVPFIPGRIYLDVGGREGSGELGDVRRLYRLLRRKGYGRSELRLVVERGGQHREAAWARRLPGELRFLLGG
jgi:predicted alpha/beta superfamily hydrolase